MPRRYYEDIDADEVRALGRYTAERDELLQFAERYDPQPIHVDPVAAEDTIYGGIIASGWHTASCCMRLLVDEFLSETATLGSFGLDELRWRTPVYPGDTVSVEVRVLEKTESTSRDDRGYITSEVEATNGDGDEVVYWRATNIFLKR
ncbi:MaoC family dehydratase [Halogeometricum limi]|uniref:Acyl dehydratase n=1 Tax=Halogeometricum limi TaxID=555875 RepID=A0A1I6IAS7_9EURY|nr:MaoC family dehydratase [Halogeometricum limi]SFR63857.1 Acyl dehydratase [Halogeometricum limi]